MTLTETARHANDEFWEELPEILEKLEKERQELAKKNERKED